MAQIPVTDLGQDTFLFPLCFQCTRSPYSNSSIYEWYRREVKYWCLVWI